jgi:hypothetical protein
MSRKIGKSLTERVTSAAKPALSTQDCVSPVDVVPRIGWLAHSSFKRWQQGQVETLEQVMQVAPGRLAAAIDLMQAWARRNGMVASETDYIARTPQRQALRFSLSGDSAIEQRCRIREETRAPGRKGEPGVGAGRNPAAER